MAHCDFFDGARLLPESVAYIYINMCDSVCACYQLVEKPEGRRFFTSFRMTKRVENDKKGAE